MLATYWRAAILAAAMVLSANAVRAGDTPTKGGDCCKGKNGSQTGNKLNCEVLILHGKKVDADCCQSGSCCAGLQKGAVWQRQGMLQGCGVLQRPMRRVRLLHNQVGVGEENRLCASDHRPGAGAHDDGSDGAGDDAASDRVAAVWRHAVGSDGSSHAVADDGNAVFSAAGLLPLPARHNGLSGRLSIGSGLRFGHGPRYVPVDPWYGGGRVLRASATGEHPLDVPFGAGTAKRPVRLILRAAKLRPASSAVHAALAVDAAGGGCPAAAA